MARKRTRQAAAEISSDSDSDASGNSSDMSDGGSVSSVASSQKSDSGGITRSFKRRTVAYSEDSNTNGLGSDGSDDGVSDDDGEMAREELEREMLKKKFKTAKQATTDTRTNSRRNIRVGAKAKADAVLSKLRVKRENMKVASTSATRKVSTPPPPPPPQRKKANHSRTGTAESSRSDDNNRRTDTLGHCFEPASLEEIQNICLTRNDFEKWIHFPMLKDWVTGCAVRLCIGEANGEPVYRLVEIVDLVDGNDIYNIGKTATRISLRVKHGKSETVFRVNVASNSPISQSEYDHWVDNVEKLRLQQFSSNHCAEIKRTLNRARYHELSEEDLQAIRESKLRVNKGVVNVAWKLTDLGNRLRIARSNGNMQEVSTLEQQISEIESAAARRNKSGEHFSKLDEQTSAVHDSKQSSPQLSARPMKTYQATSVAPKFWTQFMKSLEGKLAFDGSEDPNPPKNLFEVYARINLDLQLNYDDNVPLP